MNEKKEFSVFTSSLIPSIARLQQAVLTRRLHSIAISYKVSNV